MGSQRKAARQAGDTGSPWSKQFKQQKRHIKTVFTFVIIITTIIIIIVIVIFLSIRSSSDDGVDPLIRLGPEGLASNSSCNRCGPASGQFCPGSNEWLDLKARNNLPNWRRHGHGWSQSVQCHQWLAGAPSLWLSLRMKLTAHFSAKGGKPPTRSGDSSFS